MIVGKEHIPDRNLPLIMTVPKKDFDFTTALYWMELGYPVRHFSWREDEVEKKFKRDGDYPNPNVKFIFLKDKWKTDDHRRLWCRIHNQLAEFEVCAIHSWEILNNFWELYEDKKISKIGQ
jgi:hypothetical protein